MSPSQDGGRHPQIHKPEALPAGTRVASILTEEGYNVEVAIPHDYLDSRQAELWSSFRLNLIQLDYDLLMENPWPKRLEIQWQPQWQTSRSFPESGVFVHQ